MSIDFEKIHDLAVPLATTTIEAIRPIVRGYATDNSISPSEMVMAVIYFHCQGIAAMIDGQNIAHRKCLGELAASMISELRQTDD